MSSEEKNTWLHAVITGVAYIIYLVVILQRAGNAPLADVPYIAPMLWTIGAAIVANILGHIAIAIAWPRDADKKDQRDKEIHRFGEYIGHSFVIVGAVGALVLAMFEADYFWIANVIYLGFALSAILSSIAKLVAYRRGFQPW
jgi:hypothetical protein